MKTNFGKLSMSSSAFKHGERLPDAQSTSGEGVSPHLSWRNVPEGTTSFALVCHDPDAPLIDGFTHWVLYGIPADVTEIPEGGGSEYLQGHNDLGETGYSPAAPIRRHGTHFYYFHLYAVGGSTELPPGLTAAELRQLVDADVINQARIVGTYSND
jgi:Raf kinase inhibitor-like YbhB/YbcL family protein